MHKRSHSLRASAHSGLLSLHNMMRPYIRVCHEIILLTFCCSVGVARLFDLVRIRDAKLRTAFFYALGDTLVAEHLEQASRIAYGGNRRWARVVTLQVRQPLHNNRGTAL